MSGRTHRSAPTRCGKHSGDNGKRRGKRTFPQRGGTEPAPYRGSGAGRATAGCGHPALRKQRRWCPAKGRYRHRPLRKVWEVSLTTRASGAQRSVCASGREERVGIGAEIIPKGVINVGQSLSHGCAVTAPFAQGSLRDGGYGSPRRPVGPPRNDNGFLSFRGQCAHWPWESVLSYDGRGTGVRAAESSAPTESPINHPSQPARSEASAPADARDGRKSPQKPSPKGDRPRDRPGSA